MPPIKPTKPAAAALTPDQIAALQAQAADDVEAESVDTAALLEQFKAEARVKRDAALAAQAAKEVAVEPRAPNGDPRTKYKGVPRDHNGIPKLYTWVTLQKGTSAADGATQTGAVGSTAGRLVLNVKRGMKVPLPDVMIAMMDNAETEMALQTMNDYVTQPAPRIGYNTHGPATEDDFKAFLKGASA